MVFAGSFTGLCSRCRQQRITPLIESSPKKRQPHKHAFPVGWGLHFHGEPEVIPNAEKSLEL